jgi:integrase
VRFLTQTQALALLQELPAHLREVATFGLATGLRAANITGLVWDQVDVLRRIAWVHPDQAKARKAIAVPLNEIGPQPPRRTLVLDIVATRRDASALLRRMIVVTSVLLTENMLIFEANNSLIAWKVQ